MGKHCAAHLRQALRTDTRNTPEMAGVSTPSPISMAGARKAHDSRKPRAQREVRNNLLPSMCQWAASAVL
jgi:hypothetical protein